MKVSFIIPAIVLALTTLSVNAEAYVPKTRLLRLSKGVNITQWFLVFSGRPIGDRYEKYMSDSEMNMIRDLGLRHVRLCIAPEFLYNPSEPTKLDPENLAFLEKAIRRLNEHDLAVVLDPHNSDQRRIQDDCPWSKNFPTFWGALAASLKKIDPEMLFFEVVNEPAFEGKEDKWLALQEKVVDQIRENAPRHTIICTGPNWGGIDGLKKLTPLVDRNIVYSFHFYDPFTFTHQGATWAGDVPPHIKGLPYPSSPEIVSKVAAATDDKTARDWINDYGSQYWDHEKLKKRLDEALDWSKDNQVPIYCGEFGVFPQNAPPDSRSRWFNDFADVLKSSGIGWAVWGWDDGFGFGRKLEADKTVIDPVPVEALGLKKN